MNSVRGRKKYGSRKKIGKGRKSTMDMATLSSMDSPGGRHHEGTALLEESIQGPGVEGNHSYSSPTVTGLQSIISSECGMRENEDGSRLPECPTYNVNNTPAKPSPEPSQFIEPFQDISNPRSRKSCERERLLQMVEGILRDQGIEHPGLSTLLCDGFGHFQDSLEKTEAQLEIANWKQEVYDTRLVFLQEIKEGMQEIKEVIQKKCSEEMSAAMILRPKDDLQDRIIELGPARTYVHELERRLKETEQQERQCRDEILALDNVLKVQSSDFEHESCVTLTPAQENVYEQVSQICGSYTDESATPALLQTALSKAKGAVTRFQKLVSQELKSRDQDLLDPSDILFARANDVGYYVKAVVYRLCFEGFENESFNTLLGVSRFLDTSVRQARFYEYYLHKREHDVAVEDPQFEEFCRMKVSRFYEQFSVCVKESMQVGCLEELGGHQLASSFRAAARSVWLLHKLAFSFEPPASIFRVEQGADVDSNYMDTIVDLEDSENFIPKVGFMIAPGLRLQKSVMRCEVYLSSTAAIPSLES